jgi:hypothetical protein
VFGKKRERKKNYSEMIVLQLQFQTVTVLFERCFFVRCFFPLVYNSDDLYNFADNPFFYILTSFYN